jgi:signal transduction histidine kinase
VVGVLGDAQGNVWVSTIKGLSRFDPRTETFRNYDVFDGLQGNEFSLHCRAKAPDGRLFFAGVNGLSAFYPDKLADNPTPPPVVLTEFELFNKPVKIGAKDSPLRQAIHVATSITLRYEQSVFRFQFAALNYTAPQKNRYAYKLDGFDRDWQYTDATRRFATYTNLDHGDYTFRVKASNNDGVWNEQGVALHVRILPPWWSTLWFRALVLASILLSIWCAYQLRVRRLRREFHAQLDGRVDERMRIARELHDTLLQSFQGLMLRFQVAVDRLPPGEAKEALEQALERGDQALAEGRDSIHDLRSSAVVTNDLAQAVKALGDELASQDSAAFRLVVEGPPRNLHPILRDEIYRIVREAVRNAFRHAQARRIEAEITYGERQFRVRIRDDGRGIDPAVAGEGRAGHYGLPGMRERAKRIGAELRVWSGTGAGTEVELDVPGAIAYGTSLARARWWQRKRHD